jgi:predicted metal-binding membrane protein
VLFAAESPPVRRDRLITLASLAGVVGLAWLYLWFAAASMGSMPMASGSMGSAMVATAWSANALLMTFLMWSIMMVGMMLPSAAPAILLYGSLVRKNRERGSVLAPVWVFTAGYLAAWTAFSLVATLVQAALAEAALLSPMMVSTRGWLSGGLLIAAGIYQWLPVKDACLKKCREPLQFLMMRWRPGASGAFAMGMEHGAFCVGCCWVLMLLLFAAGVMNLLWVALIAGFVLLEKLLPGGRFTSRLAGLALGAAGGMMLFAA